MNIRYNVTGSERKALVGAISEILALEAVYKGAPTFAYEIGNYTVDKDGTLLFAEAVTGDESEQLVSALKERWYSGDLDIVASGDAEPVEASATIDPDDTYEFVVEIPKEGFSDEAIGNLRKIIASKDTLIKKVLGVDNLPVEESEDKLRFPWFTLSGTDGEANAYNRFICAMCEMAKARKRVVAKEKPVENDKFTMRLFLVRLGLIGPEDKAVRRIMLRNLTGNSSWKYGPPEKAADSGVQSGQEAL